MKECRMKFEFTPSVSCMFNAVETIFSLAKRRLMTLVISKGHAHMRDIDKVGWQEMMKESFSTITADEAVNISRSNMNAIEQYVEMSIEYDFPETANRNIGYDNNRKLDKDKFGYLNHPIPTVNPKE